MKRARKIIYIPPELENEINYVKREMNLKSSAEALRQIVNNARVGRALKKTSSEAEKLFKNIRI